MDDDYGTDVEQHEEKVDINLASYREVTFCLDGSVQYVRVLGEESDEGSHREKPEEKITAPGISKNSNPKVDAPLSGFTVTELKQMCRAKALKISGNKAELILRLEDKEEPKPRKARKPTSATTGKRSLTPAECAACT